MKVTIKFNPAAGKTEVKFGEPIKIFKRDTIFETTGMATDDSMISKIIIAATIMQPVVIEVDKEKIERIINGEEEV